MPDSTTSNLGLTKPALRSDDVWGGKLNTNFDLLDAFAGAIEGYVIPGSARHVAATLAALLDDLYSGLLVLATTTPYEVLDGAGDTVTSASGAIVQVRR